MSRPCAFCGSSADLTVEENHVSTPVCPACLDRMYPSMRLGTMHKALHRDRKNDGSCPYCGWTAQKMAETGLVGCPLCYEALEIPAL